MQTKQTSPAVAQRDEQEIRDLVKRWLTASAEGDLTTMLGLLAGDVIFMVPNQEPFGKEEFARNFEQMKGITLKSDSNILEIRVIGDWAWMRSHLSVTFTDPKGESITHAGYILTVLRKDADHHWVIARDANLLMPKHD
jgi:uncharacterized protein (TIGR02246 family)